MLVNMKEILKEAEEKGYAIGCINTPNMETLRAVVDAAEELNVPIIIDHAQKNEEHHRRSRNNGYPWNG